MKEIDVFHELNSMANFGIAGYNPISRVQETLETKENIETLKEILGDMEEVVIRFLKNHEGDRCKMRDLGCDYTTDSDYFCVPISVETKYGTQWHCFEVSDEDDGTHPEISHIDDCASFIATRFLTMQNVITLEEVELVLE